MEQLHTLFSAIPSELVFFLLVSTILFVGLLVAHKLLIANMNQFGAEKLVPRQLLMFVLTLGALLLMVLFIPMSDSTRGQILSLFGVVLTAVIALSSTTFVANAMAGLMLRVVKTFKPGDFVQIGDRFGKVTERGLFHTEIQTEDRDLTTFPNLYIVTHPVKVVMRSGTMISGTVSLGYDTNVEDVEVALTTAAKDIGLTDTFVQVLHLGDFAIEYRVSGFLNDVSSLLTSRSNLRKAMIRQLHGRGITIVSPSFMNQIPLSKDSSLRPKTQLNRAKKSLAEAPLAEERIFDKASLTEKLAKLQQEKQTLVAKLAEDKFSEPDHIGLKNSVSDTLAQLESTIKALQLELERQDANKG